MFYEWAFKKMLRTLEEIKDVSFVYCDSRTMIQKGALTARLPGVNKSKPWDPETLKDGNYVHVTSLLRREAFPGFDTVARIAEGGDLWTTLAAKGHKGLYISEVLFEVHERA